MGTTTTGTTATAATTTGRVRRAVACVAALVVVAAAACRGGGDTERAVPAVDALVTQPSVAEGFADLDIDLNAHDLTEPGPIGERLGDRVAASIGDMTVLDAASYRQRFGRDPSMQASLLGGLLGSLEADVSAAIEVAGDDGADRRAVLAFGLAAAWAVADAFDPLAPEEDRLRAMTPGAIRDRAELATIAADVAAQLESGNHAIAAELLLDSFPDIEAADVVAEIAQEIADEIPVDHLGAFESSLDASR